MTLKYKLSAILTTAVITTAPSAHSETQLPDTIKEISTMTEQQMKNLPDVTVKPDTLLSKKELMKKSPVELYLMRNYIFAKYGYEFSTDWLKRYFSTRKWYKPGGYNIKKMTQTDLKNVAIIREVEKKKKINLLTQGDPWKRIFYMTIEQMKELPDISVTPGKLVNMADLAKINAVQLRLLRNSIFARHGRKFKTPWIRRYFKSRKWYHENPKYSDAMLTKVDYQNIKAILKYEKEKLKEDKFKKKLLKYQKCTYTDAETLSKNQYYFYADGKVKISAQIITYSFTQRKSIRKWSIKDGILEINDHGLIPIDEGFHFKNNTCTISNIYAYDYF